MPEFPIQYAQGTPNVISMPRANVNIDTGAGILAEATSRLGETLANAGFKILQAQNAMELSTLQRKSSEIQMASLTALQGIDPRDDEAIAKIKQKRDFDLSALRSKSMAVNDTLKIHINQEMPRFDAQFQGDVLQRKAKAVKDDFDLNAQQYLADGNQSQYLKLLHNAVATDVITPVEFEYRTKTAANDTLLAQAERDIGNKNGIGALEKLAQTKNMTPEQVQRQHQLEIWAKQISKINSDGAKDQAIDLMNKVDELGDFSPLEREKAANKIITMLHEGGVTGDDYLQWAGPNGVLQRWNTGKFEVDDPETFAKLNQDLRDVSLGYKTRAEVNDSIRAAGVSGKISKKSYAEFLTTNYDNFKKYQNSALKDEIDYAEHILIPRKTSAAEMDIKALLSEEALPGETATDAAARMRGYERLQWVDEQLRDYIKKNPDVMAHEINIQGRKLIAMAQQNNMPQTTAIVEIKNDDEWKVLKSGQQFRGPDGIVRTK